MHVSVFVEKGLSCPSNLNVSYSKLGSQVSVASKYDPEDHSTVHHCDSLLRFRFQLVVGRHPYMNSPTLKQQ